MIYRYITILLLVGLACAGLSRPTRAGDVVETPHTRAMLIVDHTNIAPGGSVSVGLSLELEPGWHTYWRTPGDSGLPVSLTWILPNGLTAGPLQWPPPSRIPTGGLMNFGYEGRVILPSKLYADRAVPVGQVRVKAHATWLACADVCIPEEGDFTVALAVDASAQQVSTGVDVAALAQAQARIPQSAPWPVVFFNDGSTLNLEAGPGFDSEHIASAAFSPDGDGVIVNAATQRMAISDGKLLLHIKAGPSRGTAVTGVLVVENTESGRTGYEIDSKVIAGKASGDGTMTIWIAMVFAFIGGLILNVMPCVLPVVVMKVLAVMTRHPAPWVVRRDALVYTAGIITAFTFLAMLLLVLRAGGEAVGWGFQLQNPVVVGLLANVMLVLGLSLSGVFTIGASVIGVGQELAAKSGVWGTYFTGILAVVVATPCTAPFMGVALGFALTQSPVMTIAVFEGLALGLAFPYLIIGLVPRLSHGLPRPGLWMERLKQVLAFALYGASAWLIWVLIQQVDSSSAALAFAGLLCAGFAAWSWGIAARSEVGRRAWGIVALIAIVLSLSIVGSLRPRTVNTLSSPTVGALAEPFSTGRLAELRAQGRPVFVYFTAAWCITCLVNERVALSQPEVAEALRAHHVAYLKADWTNRNPEITAALHDLGRDGVPVYVIYSDQGAPRLLPQIITPRMVIDALADL
ncbi:MAG: hypothetical protein EPO08_15010 [Rhodospirillaceae bacterium]|nr:MAG: hypothetical protein EPO08_15010 [Rhodospirillaceae bacterium]